MRIKIFHTWLIAACCLWVALLLIGPGSAAEEDLLSTEALYVNWWGINGIDEDNWQKASGENVRYLGTTEVSIYPPGSEPTAEQIKAADELIIETTAAAMRHNWFDFEQGLKDGYRYHDSVHYSNIDFINDGRILDPDRPENLMYYRGEDGEMKLVAVMYLMPTKAEHGPQIGGPLTVWHYHTSPVPICWFDFPTTPNPRLEGPCEIGERDVRSPEMLHVWFVDHPDGVFSSTMTIPGADQGSLRCLSPAL